MIIEYFEQDLIREVQFVGTINGYHVGYDDDNEFSWVVVSKSKVSPIVLGCFNSKEDMEILLKSELKMDEAEKVVKDHNHKF